MRMRDVKELYKDYYVTQLLDMNHYGRSFQDQLWWAGSAALVLLASCFTDEINLVRFLLVSIFLSHSMTAAAFYVLRYLSESAAEQCDDLIAMGERAEARREASVTGEL